MCGISGVISRKKMNDADASAVKKMNQHLMHRGPNSEGFFSSEHLILGMRRLSIIDLMAGDQPIYNKHRDIVIVCNGEIYNYRELRKELEKLGYHFTTNSDIETIVHAYEAYGIKCLSKLRGMFAFALWDAKKNKLILARDRIGEKPFYYYREPGKFWFSSELRSLKSIVTKQLSLSPEAFNLYLSFQYIPEPFTPFKEISLLPAGHYLELTSDFLDAQPIPYWNLSQLHEPMHDPITITKEIVEEACQLMVNADVPVAVSLSGGIDSSLVAVLAAKYSSQKIRAFTVGYEGRPPTDERHFAEALTKKFNLDFTEVVLNTGDVIDQFPLLVAAMDTPIADIAAFGYYSVCKAAKDAGYPVLLSGMGGDEFFWGYEWVRDAMIRHSTKRAWWKNLFGKKIDFYGVHADLSNGNQWSRDLMPAKICDELPFDYWLSQASLDSNRVLHLSVIELLNRTWLQSNCLALADRMSMAHSVEIRLPLLDVRLMERVTGMRNTGLNDWKKPHKWLLVEALREVLPMDLLTRKKQGFTPPSVEWMTGIVKRYASTLKDGVLVQQGLIEQAKVNDDLSNKNLFFSYKLLLLECWARTHIK